MGKIIYKEQEDQSFTLGKTNFREGHRFFIEMREEIKAGRAEILSYKKPKPTLLEIKDKEMAGLTYTFDDGMEIQTRIKDEVNLSNTIRALKARLIEEPVPWRMKNNKLRLTTLNELVAALDYGTVSCFNIICNFNEKRDKRSIENDDKKVSTEKKSTKQKTSK